MVAVFHTPDLVYIDRLLAPWRDTIGADYAGYRHHVIRVCHFGLALYPQASDDERQQIEIAGCFHDLGLWQADTLDYLGPSVELARAYLAEQGLTAWQDQIERMIVEHHRMRRYREAGTPLVEPFRQADLVDVSLGRIRFGLPRATVRDIRRRYPNAGFHAMLARRAARRAIRHPLSPLPMMRW